MVGAEALEVTLQPATCLGGTLGCSPPLTLLSPGKGTGSIWVSPSPPSLGRPHALGLGDLTLPPSSTEKRPCCCLAIGKLRHRRTAVQLCLSRDCSASPPASALLQKPLSGALLPSASLLGPVSAHIWHFSHGPAPSWGNLHQDQAIRRGSAPGPRGAWLLSPRGTGAQGSSSLLNGGPASSLCTSGAGPIPQLLPPPRPQRSVAGEAGTPCPSEGSEPRRIQSQTAALHCLNWRHGCWQVPPCPAAVPGVGAGGHARQWGGYMSIRVPPRFSFSLGVQAAVPSPRKGGFDLSTMWGGVGWAATPGPPLKPCPRRGPCFGHTPPAVVPTSRQ